MQIEAELARLSPDRDTILTVGVFDGVHLGHKYLLSQLRERAKEEGWMSGVVTFRQHPQAVLSPQPTLPYLTALAHRTSLLEDEGIEAIVALSFTDELVKLSYRQFASLLKKYLRMRGLVIGPDFALGKNREGDAETLPALGQEMGFSLTVIPPLVIDGEVVSSTAIRDALTKGDIKKVAKMTGRPFSLKGRVIPGAGRGITLGFPTANLEINPEQALPADGVYASRVYIESKARPSVTNIGQRPTFGSSQKTVEVYILDYSQDLYQKELRIDIIERLRDEKRFSDAEALKKQIAEDVKQVKAILNSQNRSQVGVKK